MMKIMFTGLLAFVASSCAFIAQEVKLAPTVSIASSNVGRGTSVGVRVVDERPKKALGHRGAAYGAAAEITTKDDLAEVVRVEIEKGLKGKSFGLAQFSQDYPVRLSVEVRLLEYATSTGFWSGGIHTRGALKAIATKNGRGYEKLYRVEDEDRVIVVPTADRNEHLINEALSKLIGELFNDQELFTFLTK